MIWFCCARLKLYLQKKQWHTIKTNGWRYRRWWRRSLVLKNLLSSFWFYGIKHFLTDHSQSLELFHHPCLIRKSQNSNHTNTSNSYAIQHSKMQHCFIQLYYYEVGVFSVKQAVMALINPQTTDKAATNYWQNNSNKLCCAALFWQTKSSHIRSVINCTRFLKVNNIDLFDKSKTQSNKLKTAKTETKWKRHPLYLIIFCKSILLVLV